MGKGINISPTSTIGRQMKKNSHHHYYQGCGNKKNYNVIPIHKNIRIASIKKKNRKTKKYQVLVKMQRNYTLCVLCWECKMVQQLCKKV